MTRILVAAGVIEENNRFLVTRRLQGTHLEGRWEFPGGKCDPGEALDACLRRELREELDVDAAIGSELLTVRHEYSDRSVELHFFACRLLGEPRPLLGQEMMWAARAALLQLTFPPADRELIELLALPR